VASAIHSEHEAEAEFSLRLEAIPRREREAMAHYFAKRKHWLRHLSAQELASWFSSGGYDAPPLAALWERHAAVGARRGRIAVLQSELVVVQQAIAAELASASRMADASDDEAASVRANECG
jgi:hypothetical protein